MRPDPHSRNLRLHRRSDTPATFFITKSLLPKKAVLDEPARTIIVSAFAFAVQQQRNQKRIGDRPMTLAA